ncbi:MAG: Uncharacterised protein [Flavobacteriia bacterium]|nr:MAG: Uncharacterised protein [Flavobacteriia bacterium]
MIVHFPVQVPKAIEIRRAQKFCGSGIGKRAAGPIVLPDEFFLTVSGLLPGEPELEDPLLSKGLLEFGIHALHKGRSSVSFGDPCNA